MKAKFEYQIFFGINQLEAGILVKDILQEMNTSKVTFFEGKTVARDRKF